MVDLLGQYQHIQQEVDEAIQEVIQQTTFINGPAVKNLKLAMQEKFKVKHVLPCGNGTDALQIALMALGLKPGDEVITSTFTFIATAEVIALLGLKPVFVDVNLDDFTLEIADLESKITDNTKVIMPVHLYGQCANMEAIMLLAKQYNLKVIEDTAQAINSVYTFSNGEQKFSGTIGDIGTTSFFPSKNLGCFGDGGAIFTNDDVLADKMAMILNHGSKVKYYHEIVGVNSRLDTVQAAVLGVKLKHLDTYCINRNNAAAYYTKQLSALPGLICPDVNSQSTHVFHQYTLRVLDDKRTALKNHLEEKGIPSMIYYPVSLHKQKAFAGNHDGSVLKNAEQLEVEVLSLPMHTELNEESLAYICTSIKEFYH